MAEQKKGFVAGFKEFIAQGNAMDLAVGVIIGAAFTSIVDALVEKFINPLLGGVIGQPNFDSFLQFKIGDALVQPGAILTALINFLIIALVIYACIIVPMNKIRARRKSEEEEVAAPAEDIALLTQIRDALVQGNATK